MWVGRPNVVVSVGSGRGLAIWSRRCRTSVGFRTSEVSDVRSPPYVRGICKLSVMGISDVRCLSDVRHFGRPKSVGCPTSDAELLSSVASFVPFDVGRPNWVGRPMSELGRTSDVWSRAFPPLDCLFPGSLSLDLGVSLGVSCVPDDAKDRSVREHP